MGSKLIKAPFLGMLCLLVFNSNIFSQVTIGSNEEPLSGALLHLTQGTVTKKGLGLPRVRLNELTPAVGQMAQSINGTGVWDETEHTGLVVYNVIENYDACDVNAPQINVGVHIWDGTKWAYVGQERAIRSKEVHEWIDNRDSSNPETYLYRKFGEAGSWMLESMRATKYDDGLGTGAAIPVYPGTFGIDTPVFTYPNATPGSWGTAPATWLKSQGLLYNFYGATNNYSPGNIEQGQINGLTPGGSEVENLGTEGTAPNKYVQGVCPKGWHIPSDREWNKLEKYIYNNIEDYSYYSGSDIDNFDPKSWQDKWETMTGDRGAAANNSGYGHGLSMINPCALNGSSTVSKGRSYSAEMGGFDAQLIGFVYGPNIDLYGKDVYFWSSSVSSSDKAWIRNLGFEHEPVVRNVINRTDLFSVRCKKDVD